jgi:hypothetical protein
MRLSRYFVDVLTAAVPTVTVSVIHVQKWNAGRDKFYRVYLGKDVREVNNADYAMNQAKRDVGGVQ